MKVIYLNHSGFLLEWENSYWLFDYYKGTLPELDPQKDLFVFCSHSHGDHFNPAVFALASKYPSVRYVFSNQIRKMCEAMSKKQKVLEVAAEQYKQLCGVEACVKVVLPEIRYVKNREDIQLRDRTGNVIEIHTLQSTDCGCAFVLRYMEKTIYHAGDLHWWYWSGEDAAWNKKMTSDFKKEIEYLEDKSVELAFSPLDPRQGEDYALGMNYLMQKVRIKHMFPMHFWGDFNICRKFQAEQEVPEYTCFYCLEHDGHTVEIEL